MERSMTPDQVRNSFHEHLVSSIGLFLGALFSGALVALGITCMILLSSKRQGRLRSRRMAQIFVILVVTIVLAYEVEQLIEVFPEAFPSYYEQPSELLYALYITDSLLPVVVISLTDGLLVWRCFMVQRALGPNNHKLQALFWIIPFGLWSIIVVAGLTAVGLYGTWRECGDLSWCLDSVIIAQTIAITSNLTLNLFATSYIVIRLLFYRRNLIYVYGLRHPTTQLMSIISILLESSAINVPVAIITVVQVYSTVIQTHFLPVFVACQAFASILIIYQVAMGRAFAQCDDHKGIDEEESFAAHTMMSAVETTQSPCSP